MRISYVAAACLLVAAVPAAAQFPDPTTRLPAQREAMARLGAMDGIWRGPAWVLNQGGRQELVQTERIGLFLDGTVRVIEGRGYMPDGSVGFNALGVISYEPRTQTYTLSSWAMSQSGDFPMRLTDDGYVWETPAGPGAVIRYTATIRDGTWREVGEHIAGDAPPMRIFEMNLRRVGDSDWPAAGTVSMR